MPSTLYRNGVVHSPTDPFAEALLVADGQVAWLGSEDTVHTVLDGVDEVIELDGALVTPAFVDAHAHVLETGFALTGLDLSPAAGVTSLDALLDAVGADNCGGAGFRFENLLPMLPHGRMRDANVFRDARIRPARARPPSRWKLSASVPSRHPPLYCENVLNEVLHGGSAIASAAAPSGAFS